VIPTDKLLHFFGGAVVALLFGGGWPGVAAALVVGIGKELWDLAHPKTHTADVWDAVATVLGGVGSSLMFGGF